MYINLFMFAYIYRWVERSSMNLRPRYETSYNNALAIRCVKNKNRTCCCAVRQAPTTQWS